MSVYRSRILSAALTFASVVGVVAAFEYFLPSASGGRTGAIIGGGIGGFVGALIVTRRRSAAITRP